MSGAPGPDARGRDAGDRVVIAGAGLAGALLACMLGRRGVPVLLCERRADPRIGGYSGGRSINLALSVRGLTALRAVGLEDAVLRDAIPMRGRMIHDASGGTAFQPYSRVAGDAINSVSRGRLNMTLLDAAEASPGVEIRFEHRCVDADPDAASATFERADGSTVTIGGRVLVGADGAFSAVRGRLQRAERFEFSQSWLAHGYRELTIPPRADGAFALQPDALHIWPRGGAMMIALPNADRTFTGTLFWPLEELERARDDAAVRAYFRQVYPDAVPLMPDLAREFRTNPVGSLVTIRCAPWHWRDRVVLVGDAAHAIVPFYGQGMNAAFEDCRVLCDLLDGAGGDWARTLPAYTAVRKPDGDAIADLALANFVEMRDHVGSRLFLARKKAEKVLHRLFPRACLPLYNMISFSSIPYSTARRIAERRRRLLHASLRAAIVTLAVLAAFALGRLL